YFLIICFNDLFQSYIVYQRLTRKWMVVIYLNSASAHGANLGRLAVHVHLQTRYWSHAFGCEFSKRNKSNLLRITNAISLVRREFYCGRLADFKIRQRLV